MRIVMIYLFIMLFINNALAQERVILWVDSERFHSTDVIDESMQRHVPDTDFKYVFQDGELPIGELVGLINEKGYDKVHIVHFSRRDGTKYPKRQVQRLNFILDVVDSYTCVNYWNRDLYREFKAGCLEDIIKHKKTHKVYLHMNR